MTKKDYEQVAAVIRACRVTMRHHKIALVGVKHVQRMLSVEFWNSRDEFDLTRWNRACAPEVEVKRAEKRVRGGASDAGDRLSKRTP